MNGYLLAVIGTVLVCSILTSIIPEGKTAGTIKGIAKLACLLVIIAPIPRFLQSFDFFDNLRGEEIVNKPENFEETVITTDSQFIEYYCEMRIRNAQTALATEIYEKYAVKASVTLSWRYENIDDEETEAFEEKIRITQMRVALEKPISQEEEKTMWEYLTKHYCSEVLIE